MVAAHSVFSQRRWQSVQLNYSVLLRERNDPCIRSCAMHHQRRYVTTSSHGKRTCRIKYTDQTLPSESLHIYMRYNVTPVHERRNECEWVCRDCRLQIISSNFQIAMGRVCVFACANMNNVLGAAFTKCLGTICKHCSSHIDKCIRDPNMFLFLLNEPKVNGNCAAPTRRHVMAVCCLFKW